MKKITSLTQKQKDQMKPWADKYIAKVLCTEPADRAAFEQGCRECYGHAKLPWHGVVVWVGSPRVALLAGSIANYALEKGCKDVRDAVNNAIARVKGERVTLDVIRDGDWSEMTSNWQKYLGGSAWLTWQAYESFFDVICGLEHDKLAEARSYRLAQENAWHWWPHSEFVIVSDRPCEIHVIDGAMHNEDGPSLAFRDGWKLWHINGITVDEQIVMRPETQTVAQIRAEKNADVKSIRIRRFGWVRYLKESGASLVDSRRNDIDGTHEALYRTEEGDTQLVAVCPTGRVFAMGVPPQINDCVSAQKWLAGDDSFRSIGRT